MWSSKRGKRDQRQISPSSRQLPSALFKCNSRFVYVSLHSGLVSSSAARKRGCATALVIHFSFSKNTQPFVFLLSPKPVSLQFLIFGMRCSCWKGCCDVILTFLHNLGGDGIEENLRTRFVHGKECPFVWHAHSLGSCWIFAVSHFRPDQQRLGPGLFWRSCHWDRFGTEKQIYTYIMRQLW